jgi:hypothetical protein
LTGASNSHQRSSFPHPDAWCPYLAQPALIIPAIRTKFPWLSFPLVFQLLTHASCSGRMSMLLRRNASNESPLLCTACRLYHPDVVLECINCIPPAFPAALFSLMGLSGVSLIPHILLTDISCCATHFWSRAPTGYFLARVYLVDASTRNAAIARGCCHVQALLPSDLQSASPLRRLVSLRSGLDRVSSAADWLMCCIWSLFLLKGTGRICRDSVCGCTGASSSSQVSFRNDLPCFLFFRVFSSRSTASRRSFNESSRLYVRPVPLPLSPSSVIRGLVSTVQEAIE